GGDAEMRMVFEPARPVFLVTDDPSDSRRGGTTSTLEIALRWIDTFTDGWVIGPLGNDWTADVQFTDTFSGTPTLSGLSTAAFYSGDGTVIDLPLEENRRIRMVSRCACDPDLNGDATLDIFDIVAFLGLFEARDPIADWNGDGVHDIFDVVAYLADFDAAC
ncbi:MAG: hypothetical protein KDA28_09355, partial [Phycisphaerales bacterium]|nr:hypothetical protein [Phycisphaerales bacterium]